MVRSGSQHVGPVWPAAVMLARPVTDLPPADSLPGGCVYELKWDGYRALVAVDARGRGRVCSRRGVDMTAAFPDVAVSAAAQLPRGTLLDGELVVWDGAAAGLHPAPAPRDRPDPRRRDGQGQAGLIRRLRSAGDRRAGPLDPAPAGTPPRAGAAACRVGAAPANRPGHH
jgi:hypothetical protein